MSEKPTLAIIGAGKVGCALARTFAARGYRIAAVYSRTRAHAEALARELGTIAVDTPADAMRHADLTLVAVPDDQIAAVVGSIESASALADSETGTPSAAAGPHFEMETGSGLDVSTANVAKAIVHTSGALSLRALSPLAERGIMTGCLHPAFPFAHGELAASALRGVTFAIESHEARLSQWLHEIVTAVGGHPLTLNPDDKPLYHAALVLTSNYTVTLFAASRRILTGLGADAQAADGALLALLGGTLDNLRLRGVPDALTGPLVRSDLKTVESHLAVLDAMPEMKAAYLAFVRLSLPLLAARGIDTAGVEALLNTEAS